MARVFWKSSGRHLVERDQATGWLRFTPDLIRGYLTRPEIHPVDDSCEAELRLFEALMADPFRPVSEAELAAIVDRDTADNYGVVLAYRDVLTEAGTLERAYLAMMRSGAIKVPPVFIDQLLSLSLSLSPPSAGSLLPASVGSALTSCCYCYCCCCCFGPLPTLLYLLEGWGRDGCWG